MSENTKVTAVNEDSVWSMLKLGFTLAIYAAVSCAILALVNNFTAPKIVENQVKKANEAMHAVFSDADAFEQVTDFSPSSDSTITLSDVYLAKKDGKVIGGAIQVAGPTYDKGKIIIGVKTDGEISGMQFLELSDSPGFGSKAKDCSYTVKNGQTFYGQFTGKNAKDGFILNETFDAISGATITSKGTAALMTQGTECLLKYFGEHDYE